MKSLLALLVALLVVGCAPKERTELVVGMELAYPPFEMTDASGQPSGVSVELAGALAQKIGRPLRIDNIPFDGLIPALKSGKIDLILSSMTATAERAQSIDFSDPYLRTGLCLLVGRNSPLASIADADQPGRVIVVKKGTTGHAYAANSLKQAKLLVLDKENACVLEVVQGKADAFIYDQLSTYQNWQRHRETTRALLTPFQEESWAIGIRKGNETLRLKLNTALAEFKSEGGFEKLAERYLHEQKQAFAEQGIPFLF